MNKIEMRKRNAMTDMEIICEEQGYSVKAIRSPKRKRELVEQRWDVIRQLADLGYSMPTIGFAVNRDHTTVFHALSNY
jgi:chromosomal replication initiation ATPase DnaA